MNALGRGLASLIPRRSNNAKELLERIDSMEDLDKEEPVVITTKKAASKAQPKKQLNVIEELSEKDEEPKPALPPKPLTTPIHFEPQPTPSQDPVQDKPSKKKPEIEKPESAESEFYARHEDRVQHIPIGDIAINPLQPRRTFNPESLEELTRSIASHGILQPLVVRRVADGYELIAGERRLRAAKMLGWERVPCVVRTGVGSDRSRLELALLENIQRQDLNPIEEALAFKQLTDEYGMSQEEIAERLGQNRVTITNVVRLLQLPAEIQRGLMEGKITSGHGRAILMIPDPERQINFYHHLVQEGLTVRKAEVRARRIQRTMAAAGLAPNRIKLGRTVLARKYVGPLEDKFGFTVKVNFSHSKNLFEIIFKAHNEGELDEIMGKLLGIEIQQQARASTLPDIDDSETDEE